MKAGWQTKTFGEILEKTETTNPLQSPDVEFDYIDVSSVSNQTFRIEETQRLKGKDAPSRARRLVRTNDILFATIRPTLQRIAIVPKEFDNQVCSTGYYVLRPKVGIDHRFVFYALLTEDFMGQMETLQKGASYPAVNDSEVRAQLLAYPPLPEQQRIVGILDAAFDGIATAKANAEQNLQNAHALFESHLQSVFTQQDEGWVEKSLGDICEATQGVQIQKSEQSPIFLPGYRRYLYISDFESDKNLKYVVDVYPNKLVTTEDIIVANTGSAGKIFRGIDGILSNNLFKVSINTSVADRDFVYFFVTSGLFRDYQQSIMRGTANPHMGHVNFKSTPISVPNIEVQKYVVAKIHELSEETQRLASLYQRKLAALDELKKSLLHQAFSGEL
jgi:type I restriction enzyme S subunit